ncbi:toxin-antitoxin system YwqK family antitoxin [Halocola ammonii]
MPFLNTLLATLIGIASLAQSSEPEKHIVRRHDNGNPYVVVYTVGPEHDRVKEELYYENGQLDYVGHFKNGKEHGDWIYYWPNGNRKSIEHYQNGSENGTMYDYNEKGEPIVEYKYLRGILIKKTDLTEQ